MTNAQIAALIASADAHFRKTTIKYSEWLAKVQAGKYTPPDGSTTEWGMGFSDLAAASAALAPAPTPPQPTGHYYVSDLAPNWSNSASAAEMQQNINATWLFPNAGLYVAPNGKDAGALLLDPRYKDAAGKDGIDEWWFHMHMGWPSSFDPNDGSWNTFANAHNIAGDAGNVENGNQGGIGWQANFGTGVSAFECLWNKGQASPAMHFENAGPLDILVPLPTRDAMHVYDVKFRAGRTDGSTVRPGEVEVWADGALVKKLSNINTVQRAKGPVDGQLYVQRWMSVPWAGHYSAWLSKRSEHWFNMHGVGTTQAQAAASIITPTQTPAEALATQAYNSHGPDGGPPTLTLV